MKIFLASIVTLGLVLYAFNSDSALAAVLMAITFTVFTVAALAGFVVLWGWAVT
jgi:hypothetical protein